jgi:uncharacterized protein
MKKVVLVLGAMVGIAMAGKDEFVNVSGKGSVKAYPNLVTLTFGVNKIDKRLDTAVGTTTKVANKLLAICRNYGVDERDLETVSNSLERAYKNDRDTTTYLGIKSEIIYRVKMKNVDSVNVLVNTMYRNGLNEFRGFSFGHSQQDSLKRLASILAIKDAFENANALANNSGKKIKGLLNASYEKPEDFSFQPQTRHEGVWAGAGMGDYWGSRSFDLEFFKIKPGILNFEIEVFAKYEIK